MGYQPKVPCVFANNKEDANRIKGELKEDYNFYMRVQRILLNNKRHWRLLDKVKELLQETIHEYNHVYYPPDRK